MSEDTSQSSANNGVSHDNALPDAARRVADLLAGIGHDRPVVMLPASGKTSAEAAAGLGCTVAEIAKSIIFRRVADDAPVLVIASGGNRVDEAKVAARVGPLGKADARFVREKTGYAIGGVCPIGHAVAPVMLLDQDLFRHDSLWAAAGHPHAVFNLTPRQLQQMTGAEVADVAAAPAQSTTPSTTQPAAQPVAQPAAQPATQPATQPGAVFSGQAVTPSSAAAPGQARPGAAS